MLLRLVIKSGIYSGACHRGDAASEKRLRSDSSLVRIVPNNIGGFECMKEYAVDKMRFVLHTGVLKLNCYFWSIPRLHAGCKAK